MHNIDLHSIHYGALIVGFVLGLAATCLISQYLSVVGRYITGPITMRIAMRTSLARVATNWFQFRFGVGMGLLGTALFALYFFGPLFIATRVADSWNRIPILRGWGAGFFVGGVAVLVRRMVKKRDRRDGERKERE